mgnify:CR=1 FL=1
MRYRPDRVGALHGDDLESVLLQWEDEGFATRSNAEWQLDWEAVYDLLDRFMKVSIYAQLRFDINREAAERAQLRLPAELLKVARHVIDPGGVRP